MNTFTTRPQHRGFFAAVTLAFMLPPGLAHAHPGFHESVSNMFAQGILHPLTGFDHLLAMLAVGIWAAMSSKGLAEAIWTPLGFAALLFVGALAGMAGVALPLVEPAIFASLLVIGLLLAWKVSLPKSASISLVGFFALFHGMAHGLELPAAEGAALFIAGFMLSTFALHAAGLFAGLMTKRHAVWLSRVAGSGIAAYGAFLFVSAT
jgi:urease accessory protein